MKSHIKLAVLTDTIQKSFTPIQKLRLAQKKLEGMKDMAKETSKQVEDPAFKKLQKEVNEESDAVTS